MIQQILQAIDAAAAQHLPVAVRHLLAEQQPTGNGIAPHIYVGNGNWNQIANDNAGTFSYWRLLSPIREQEVDAPGCFDAFQATYNLRLVAMIDRDICGDVLDATRAAATAIRNTDDDLRAALKLMLVDFATGSVEVQSARVYQQEFGGTLDVNPNKALVAIDVSVSVTGKSACFEPCLPATDFFCALIEAKTWAKIKACMTEGQVADAIADLCDDAPCDPLSIAINSEDGVIVVNEPCGANVSIAVTQGGVEVGSWDGTAWIVPECEDAQVTFDGLPVLTIPCGDTGNLDCGTLLDAAYVSDGSSVTGTYLVTGTLNGREVYTLDVDHNLEYTGTGWRLVKPGSDVDAALGSETFPWEADWSATSLSVEQATIGAYCGGNEVPCADLTIAINGTTYGTITDPCGATAPVDVHDSNGNDVGSLVSGAWVVAAPANVLHEYTTGGTWNKPTSPSFRGVWVFAAGAGGSGGAGSINNTNVSGGSAGGGGSLVRVWIPAASLGLTETYAIGAGGAGVATGAGGAGGATLFGAHVEAKGGSGGAAGQTTTSTIAGGAGGNATLNTPIVNGASISGGAGGAGGRSNAGAGDGTTGILNAAAPGGGGGTGVNSTTAGGNGRAGGGAWSTSLTAGGAGGVSPGGNGTAGVSDIYLDAFLGLVTPTIGIGTGGGGGAGATTANAGAGAAGGRAAGGGGGGSCYLTGGYVRGASGAGGDGFLLVYEVYGI